MYGMHGLWATMQNRYVIDMDPLQLVCNYLFGHAIITRALCIIKSSVEDIHLILITAYNDLKLHMCIPYLLTTCSP